MSEAVERLRKAAIERALHGPGNLRGDARRAAYENTEGGGLPGAGRALVEKVAQHAWKVTDADVEAAQRAGMTDDEIFELVVCASYGEATRQLDAALAALDAVDDDAAAKRAQEAP